MITYAERVCFQPKHLCLLAAVETYVARVSSSWGNELRCHELARAVHRVVNDRSYELLVVDGKCGPVEHSWLLGIDGMILDPYVPGRLPSVQIIDRLIGAAYKPGPPRADIRSTFIDRLVLEMRDSAVR